MVGTLLTLLGLGALMYLMFRPGRGGHGGCCGGHGNDHDDDIHNMPKPDSLEPSDIGSEKSADRKHNHGSCH